MRAAALPDRFVQQLGSAPADHERLILWIELVERLRTKVTVSFVGLSQVVAPVSPRFEVALC
jgi:hypothetical protein